MVVSYVMENSRFGRIETEACMESIDGWTRLPREFASKISVEPILVYISSTEALHHAQCSTSIVSRFTLILAINLVASKGNLNKLFAYA